MYANASQSVCAATVHVYRTPVKVDNVYSKNMATSFVHSHADGAALGASKNCHLLERVDHYGS